MREGEAWFLTPLTMYPQVQAQPFSGDFQLDDNLLDKEDYTVELVQLPGSGPGGLERHSGRSLPSPPSPSGWSLHLTERAGEGRGGRG